MANVRDYLADMEAAYREEFNAYKTAGLTERAKEVADVFKAAFGKDVDPAPAKRKAPVERANSKATETPEAPAAEAETR